MKRGLGRGLDSLFGEFNDDILAGNVENNLSKIQKDNEQKSIEKIEGTPKEIEIGLIDRNPDQPRKKFDEEALEELANSIKSHGVIQPIIVKKVGERYVIIAGERRYRASRIAGIKTIPCIIKDYTEQEISEISIIENLQREDLNPIESARAIKNLIESYNLTQDEVADKIGKSRPAVANTLRLLNLPDGIVSLIENNKISAGHGRALLGIEDAIKQKEIAVMILEKGLTVRDVENVIKNVNKPKPVIIKAEKSLEIKDFETKIKKLFATKAEIKGNDNKGKIVIEYFSKEDLNRIYDILINN